jgi:hypothetical protein
LAANDADSLARSLAWCHRQSNPLNAFNDTVLGRIDRTKTLHDGSHPGQYWKAQREIGRALWDDSVTTVAVPAGHSVGKSYFASGAIIGWPTLLPDSLVVSTSPSNNQLDLVLWKEIRRAFAASPLPNFGRITGNPNKLDYGNGVFALGFSTNKAERAQGHHAKGPLLAVLDEASGIEDPEIWATIASLKPRKRLLISNPLRPDGPFYDVCMRAKDGDKAVRLITIPSTDSPDIEQEHSERGLADAAWLREMAAEYGIGSLTWKVRVLAQFPDDATDQVFRRDWIEAAFRILHQPGGTPRTSIDLGLGNGGDNSVVITRDDNGVLACEASNLWSLETTARKAAMQVQRFKVAPTNVSWDAEGIGADFDNRLRSVGIHGAKAYRGGGAGNSKFTNLRTAAAWACRHRLDPDRLKILAGGLQVPQVPFSLAAVTGRSKTLLQQELRELRYTLESGNKTALEKAEDYAKRIKRSPDHQASFCQLWAFDRAA